METLGRKKFTNSVTMKKKFYAVGHLVGVAVSDRLNLSPVPKIGTWAATGVGEVMVDGGEEMSELTSLGGGATAPDVGGDGLGDDFPPYWNPECGVGGGGGIVPTIGGDIIAGTIGITV